MYVIFLIAHSLFHISIAGRIIGCSSESEIWHTGRLSVLGAYGGKGWPMYSHHCTSVLGERTGSSSPQNFKKAPGPLKAPGSHILTHPLLTTVP